jgi:hypothetical protein
VSHSDTLYAFAQVAVAFAGFAGLMAFVRGRAAGPPTRVQRNRLIGMVRVALIATAFAMLPIVVESLGLSEVATWRVSGVLFAIAFAPIMVTSWRRLVEIRSAGLSATVPFIPQVATVGLLLLLGSAIFSEHSSGLYLAGLFFVLLVSGALFFTLVVTLLEEPDQ